MPLVQEEFGDVFDIGPELEEWVWTAMCARKDALEELRAGGTH